MVRNKSISYLPPFSIFFSTCKFLFLKGTIGKCILSTENIWLTPVEFQLYSGCASADWKTAIRMIVPNRDDHEKSNKTLTKKCDFITLKTLIEEENLTLGNALSVNQETQTYQVYYFFVVFYEKLMLMLYTVLSQQLLY